MFEIYPIESIRIIKCRDRLLKRDPVLFKVGDRLSDMRFGAAGLGRQFSDCQARVPDHGQMAFGAMVEGVDNACHVGGLLSGAVIGGIFALTRFEDNGLMRSVVAAIVSIASLALLNLAVN